MTAKTDIGVKGAAKGNFFKKVSLKPFKNFSEINLPYYSEKFWEVSETVFHKGF